MDVKWPIMLHNEIHPSIRYFTVAYRAY